MDIFLNHLIQCHSNNTTNRHHLTSHSTHVKITNILIFLVFYFNMEPRLKLNKIILVAKTILFHFRRGSMLK